MTRDDRETKKNESEGGHGFVRTVMTSLFETIADMDDRNQQRRSGTGTGRRSRTRFDFGFDVGLGPGSETETDVRELTDDTDHAATVQPTEEGYVVTLDLPAVDPEELSAGVDSGSQQLVVADDDGVVARVSLPDSALAVGEASFNNGILDVRLHATGEDG